MYQYQASLALQARAASIFETPDLQDIHLFDIYSKYYQVYLTLSHPASANPIYVDLMSFKRSLIAFDGTIRDWLTANGDNTLPTIPKLPEINVRYARYGEMSYSGFNVLFANEGMNYETPPSQSLLHDLAVQGNNRDMSLVNDRVLCTVNGFVHDSSANQETLYVRKGGKSVNKANEFATGFLDFGAIGKVTRHRLTKDRVSRFEANISMKEKIRITVPDYVDGQAFFLVMGGYLIFPQANVFYQVAEKEFALVIQRLDYTERLLESSRFIDLTDMGLQQPVHMSQTGWSIEQSLSDDVLKNYLTLSQSFFVSLNVNNLSVTRSVLMPEKHPCTYLVHQEPVDALMGGWGRLLEYWPIQGKEDWIIDCADNFRRPYIVSDTGAVTNRMRAKYADSSPDLYNPGELSAAYLLQIQSHV